MAYTSFYMHFMAWKLTDVSQAGSLSNVVTPRFSNQVIHGNGDSQLSSDDPQNVVKNPAQREDENEAGALHSCGFISNTFLPCIACDESSSDGKKKVDEPLDGKKKLANVGGPSTKKKLSFTQSFKWKEVHENPIICECIWFSPDTLLWEL